MAGGAEQTAIGSEEPSSKFQATLGELLRARFPCLAIETWEEDRALETLHDTVTSEELVKTPRQLFTWTSSRGLTEYGEASKAVAQDPLEVLTRIQDHSAPAVFVLQDFHVFFGSGRRDSFGGGTQQANHPVVRKLRDLISTLRADPVSKTVVFLSPSPSVPDELDKDVTVLDFPLPTEGEIRELLDRIIEDNLEGGGSVVVDLEPQDRERLTKAAVGLTLQEAENAFARAMVSGGKLDSSDVETVLEEKRQVIRRTEILEFIRAKEDFGMVGGLGNLKAWLNKREKSWLDSAKRYNLPAPKGLLMTGVPGCGKSLSAKCTSNLWQLPLLRLDVGRIYGGLLGSSEQNMRRAIKTAEAIAPAILWIDEIEKGFGGSAGPGGHDTSMRVFGTFLTWMQEKTAPVFVIATANSIDQLPPEFLRKGRFDEIFFIDLPTVEERTEIFRLHLAQRLTDPEIAGDVLADESFPEELAKEADGFNGAEVEQAVISALFEAYSEDRAIEKEDLFAALRETVPLSKTQDERIANLREWASSRAVPATEGGD